MKDRRLCTTTKPEASPEETLGHTGGEIARADSTDTVLQLILLVGSTELLQGKNTDLATLQLEQKLTSWNQYAPQDRYEIYAVPEIKPRGEEVAKAYRQWNTEVLSMCDQMNAGVQFIATQAQMTEDGLSYTPATATEIGRQLADRIPNFLQRSYNSQGATSRGWRQFPGLKRTAVETLVQAMTMALTQMC